MGLLNAEPEKLPGLRAVYGHARRNLVELWTSTVAIVEVSKLASEKSLKRPIPPDSLSVIDALLFQPFIKPVNVDQIVARRARKLAREVDRLKGADAIDLASAMVWNVPVFHTYDRDDLLRLNGSINCDDGTLLEIVTARDPFEGELFVERA
jgi:predicted nucleic acid-binding protein